MLQIDIAVKFFKTLLFTQGLIKIEVMNVNIFRLHSPIYQDWLSVLLESRGKGDSIPGASGVIGESGATGAALNALKSISKEIKCSPHNHYHLVLFVGDKMLALYSR